MRGLSEYRTLRHNAEVLSDNGDYKPELGQTNPKIFDELVDRLFQGNGLPVIWEPFAGHVGKSRNHDVCKEWGVKLIAYDLVPSDQRVIQADSTSEGPSEPIGGMVFHPSYFGAHPFSYDDGEISRIDDEERYRVALGKVIRFAWEAMISGGIVAAVCRRYRFGGREIKLDEWFLDLFQDVGFELKEVWSSEPDLILVLEKPLR